MQNEMIALILKDLPNQTAGVLKSYLEEAEKAKKALAEAQQKNESKDLLIKQKDQTLGEYSNRILEQQKNIATQDALNARELALEKRERNLELELKNIEIGSLHRENAAIMDLTRTVFKNPTYTRREDKVTPVVIPGTNGGYGFVQDCKETKTTTETVE